MRIAAVRTREGKPLTDADLDRLVLAEQRIDHALTVLRPKLREGWR